MEEHVMNAPSQHPAVTPPTDILESVDGFHIFIDLPGVATSGLSIDLEENELTVKAVSSYDPGEALGHLRMEFETQYFERSFTLSEMVDKSKIQANLKDGVLDLALPKVEAMKPRRIEIKADGA
jgi:HSP20 family molecular chaperone IbpA